MKIEKAIQEYLAAGLIDGYDESTRPYYEWVYSKLVSIHGDKMVDKVTNYAIDNFTIYLWNNYASMYGRECTMTDLDIARVALYEFFGWVSVEAAITFTGTEEDEQDYSFDRSTPFTQEEAQALLDACGPDKWADIQSFRDRALLTMLQSTGMWVSELCRLTIGDVHLENGKVDIGRYGSSGGRKVDFGQVCRSALMKYVFVREAPAPSEALFLSGHGTYLCDQDVFFLLDQWGKRAEVENVIPLRFRWTFAAEFIKDGGGIIRLQRLLGHSILTDVLINLQITSAHLAAEHRRASPGD